MNKAGVIQYLKALGAANVSQHGSWVQASCPLAPWEHSSGRDTHPSFAIEIKDNDPSRYNCFTCGGGDLTSLLFKLQHHGAATPRYDLKSATAIAVADGEHPIRFAVKEWGEDAEAALPYYTLPEVWLDTFIPATRAPRAVKYLRSRGLSTSLATRLDLRFDTDKDAICFPIRDFDGVLCAMRARRIAPRDDQPRYHVYGDADGNRNTLVWYGEPWVDFDQPIVMVESVFDLASVYRVYRNVCSPMTSGFSEQRVKRMSRATEIVTLFDADKAGDKARHKVSRYLPNTKCSHLHLEDGMDPGDYAPQDLIDLLEPLIRLPDYED